MAETAPLRTDYADVNGVKLYFETYGDANASPLVLLHGGLMTIDLNFATLIPGLVERHLVIGVEAQGHGRTANIDREITPANSASDVVGLLDQLGIDRAHVLGHSMGAATALELAVRHPDRVRSVVPISASVRPDGMHSDFSSPERMAVSDRMPTQADFVAMTEAYQRLSPHPDQFTAFMQSMSASAADLQGWTDDELAGITAPVLIVQGDHDFVTNEHAALMADLIPGAKLAILPGTTHMTVTTKTTYLLPMLADFLD